jgi:hypothetical protein
MEVLVFLALLALASAAFIWAVTKVMTSDTPKAAPVPAPDPEWVALFRHRLGEQARTSWRVRRIKCALIALFTAPACVAVFLVAANFTLRRTDVVGPVALITMIVLWALFLPDLGRLALWGGGLRALPEGLEFRFAWNRQVFPWAEIDGVTVETIDFGGWWSTRPTSGRYLMIRFNSGLHVWPASMALARSRPDRLNISVSILPAPIETVAADINAARAAGAPQMDRDPVLGEQLASG